MLLLPLPGQVLGSGSEYPTDLWTWEGTGGDEEEPILPGGTHTLRAEPSAALNHCARGAAPITPADLAQRGLRCSWCSYSPPLATQGTWIKGAQGRGCVSPLLVAVLMLFGDRMLALRSER